MFILLALLLKRHAIRTLIHSGIAFMGTHQDFVQRTVVLGLTMMHTLVHGALNGTVDSTATAHLIFPPSPKVALV